MTQNDEPEFSIKEEILDSEMDKEEILRRLKLGLPVSLAFVVSTVQ